MPQRSTQVALALFAVLAVVSEFEVLRAWAVVAGVPAEFLGLIQSICDTALTGLQGYSHHSHVLLAILLLSAFTVILPGSIVLLAQLVKGSRLRMLLSAQEVEVADLPNDLLVLSGRLGLSSRVRVFRSDGFYAFCLGLRRSEIWLSTSVLEVLPREELEAVLRHESWHLRRHDASRILLANAARASLFFVPIVGQMVKAFMVNKELIADAGTVRDMADKYPLASALNLAIGRARSQALSSQAVGAFSALDVRIDQLLNGEGDQPLLVRTPRLSLLASAPIISFTLLATCMLLAAVQIGASGGPLCSFC